MNALYYLSGAAGLVTIGYAFKLLLAGDSQQTAEQAGLIERQSLKEISDIWTDPVLALSAIAYLWREAEPEPTQDVRPRPEFRHSEIGAFFTRYVAKPYVKGNRRIVIEKLLQLLDSEGDCPSVVGRGVHARESEQERKYGDESYAYLAKIPLWQHSLAVAERYVAKFQHDAMHPDALIVALAHDIGKIPAQYEKFYRRSDHPVTSGLLLLSIPEFKELSNYEELERAIQNHHDMVTNHHLPTLLKEADQEVRKQELARMLASTTGGSSDQPQPPPTQDCSSAIAEHAKDSPSTEAEGIPAKEEPDASSSETDSPEAGRSKESDKYVPHEHRLPDWLNLDALVTCIAERINVIVKDEELKGLWHAYSTIDGYVWVSEKLVWKTLKEVCGQRVDLLAADADEAKRRDWLYSVVRKLGEQGAVCTAMMKDGYYQVPVTVITGTGKTFSAFYIPFLTRAFGADAKQLERLKGSQIRGLVRNIVPRMQAPL